MNILQLARVSFKKISGGQKSQPQSDKVLIPKGNEINELNEKRVNTYRLDEQQTENAEIRFTKATDPYRQAGGRNYWKMHVPPSQRPQWVKEECDLD